VETSWIFPRSVPVNDLPDSGTGPEQLAECSEIRQRLDGALQAIPARHREVIILYDFEEWTMQRIAVRLGVNESRVSQIRSAALSQLYRHFTSGPGSKQEL
jgi:RNA polymerase sigma factor (sigma-70 family)